jgi:hypothetical protein
MCSTVNVFISEGKKYKIPLQKDKRAESKK